MSVLRHESPQLDAYLAGNGPRLFESDSTILNGESVLSLGGTFCGMSVALTGLVFSADAGANSSVPNIGKIVRFIAALVEN